MALARHLRTLLVVGMAASLIGAGALLAHEAAAQSAPECPTDWPNQGYAGPLREDDHGHIQYEGFYADGEGEHWYIIRGADSNGYTTVRAYPAAQGDGGYITGSPDRVCYLIVREPRATVDLDEARQVLFPRENDEPADSATVPGPDGTSAPAQPEITPTVPAAEEEPVPPVLTSLELDGVTVDTEEVIREGLEPGQEVQITLRVSDAGGRLAYVALVAEDGAELDRVDCADGMEQECTLTSMLIAPDTYSTTLRLRVIAVDDAGAETELATISLTTRSRPSSPPTSDSGSGSSGSGSGSSGSRRVRLEIEPPEQLGPFVADIPAVIYPVVDYTGRFRLYFTLPQGPAGMVIDPDAGVVTWTPPEDDEGRSFDVTIAVTDGSLTDEDTFEITVMDPQRIRSSITGPDTDGNVLEITDSDTDLEGLTITSPTDEPITIRTLAELQKIFELAEDENVPEVPDWITPLTDVFVVKGPFETPVELRLPIGELVDELPEEAQFTDVNLYAYAEISEVEGLFWTPVSVGFSFEGTEVDDLTYVVSIAGLRGLAFFGYHVNEPAMPFEATPQNMSYLPADGDEGFRVSEHRPTNIALLVGPLDPGGGVNLVHDGSRSIADESDDAVCGSWAVAGSPLCPDPPAVEDIACEFPEWELSETLNHLRLRYDDYRCTYEGNPDVEIWIKGFGEGCRWDATSAPVNQHTGCSEGQSVRDLAAWLFGAQSALDELGMGYNDDFTVHIHPMSFGYTPGHFPAFIHGAAVRNARGFVSGKWWEDTNVLHITDDNAATPQQVKFIALHEFFHHAQYHKDTRIEGNNYALITASHPFPFNIFGSSDRIDWLLEGTATWFPDEVDDTLDPSDVLGRDLLNARILELGLDSAPIPASRIPLISSGTVDERRNAYARAPFYDLMAGKCDSFYASVKRMFNVPVVFNTPDPTGINNFRQAMVEADCDFGDHLDSAGEDRSASMEAAIAYYNYVTQFKDDYSLLDSNDPASHFDAPDFDFDPSLPLALPSNLPQAIADGMSLTYELSFSGIYRPDFDNPLASDRPSETRIPATGAYSARVLNVSGRLPENAVAELIVVPTAGDLIVSIAADKDLITPDDFNAMNTIGPDQDLHAWFSTADDYSYVLSNTVVPPVFFTLINPDPDSAVDAVVFLRIRGEAAGTSPEELAASTLETVSVDRSILTELYNSTGGTYWTEDKHWLEEGRGIDSWHGIGTNDDRRVTSISLFRNNLNGTLTASLGDLDNLTWLQLGRNELHGEIPPELRNVVPLWLLSLRSNNFVGSIPTSLGELSNLWILDLSDNALTGEIPVSLGDLGNLRTLRLAENELDGEIPTELGSLIELHRLILNDNELTGGIPDELIELTNLEHLDLSWNQLTGEIAEEIGDLENLDELHLNNNDFTGTIPESFGGLEKLEVLDLGVNDFTGDASDILTNLSGLLALERLHLDGNDLTGEIPDFLGGLQLLKWLDLSDNDLDGDIPAKIAEMILVERLDLSDNMLTGEIPVPFGGPLFVGLASLERLYLNENQLTGEIPEKLGDLDGLERLYLQQNMLTGEIPEELGDLYSLERLYLHENQLDGSIPATLGDLYNLERLYLYDNDLDRPIPAELGKLGDQSVLDELRLENNQLSGAIPTELGDLVSLTELILSNNMLSDAIPTALGSLNNLKLLHLNNNGLTEAIPAELGDLEFLTELDLSHNQLAEAIPTDLGDLTSLEILRLDNNALTGTIPAELGSLANLRSLHLNSNQLTGAIPTELGQLTNLEELVLDANQLVSTIPAELANLTNLEVLHLSGNTITGCIPQGLSDIADNDLSQLGLAECP